MNRGVFQSSLVQQTMGQSPSWWSMNNKRPPPGQTFSLLPSTSSYSSSSSGFPQYPQGSPLPPASTCLWRDNQDLPESWSQLLLGGDAKEEEKYGLTAYQPKKIENTEHQALYPTIKKDYSGASPEEITPSLKNQWNQVLPAAAAAASSPKSCITTGFISNNMLDFSNNCKADKRHHKADKSSECNSTGSASFKKARVKGSSSAQSNFKVGKEKLGDKVTALHQIVSPFGKTDTASVLLEAIGYIRFLQNQIEALSSPYLTCGSGSTRQPVSTVYKDGEEEAKKDLRSRGLCLVPVALTSHFVRQTCTGADFWASVLDGGF